MAHRKASIELGQASIFVEKELQRVNREAMADLNGKDILFKFPPTFASTHTALVLKTPKTKTSVRKVFLPKTVAEMLVQRKADIEEEKHVLFKAYWKNIIVAGMACFADCRNPC